MGPPRPNTGGLGVNCGVRPRPAAPLAFGETARVRDLVVPAWIPAAAVRMSVKAQPSFLQSAEQPPVIAVRE